MNILKEYLPSVYLISLKRSHDQRGDFLKTYNLDAFNKLKLNFVPKESYLSNSYLNVVRGMHYQVGNFSHDKVVTCFKGNVLDVVVDIRIDSPNYNKPMSFVLNEENSYALFIGKGYAHGFLSLSENSIMQYVSEYNKYFLKYKNTIKNAKISDPLPRIIIVPKLGYFSIGTTQKEEKISNDIFLSMKETIIDSNYVSKFKSINQKEIFKMEYWPLERAKLNSKKRKKFEGNIAIITGGAGKIGSAIAQKFLSENIEVVLLDKNFSNIEENIKNKCTCINCDLTNREQVKLSVKKVVSQFGGIDILVSNSGSAFQGQMKDLDELTLQTSMANNFYSHHYIIQETVKIMINQEFGGSISINLSKQSINPGNNFGPYGIAKASALFMMKQYALECGQYNIRVNGVNADRIESGLLTKEMIRQRAKARGIKESDYLRKNLLNKEVSASDVAESFYVQLCLEKTTANIITVDGGNIEASLR